MSSTVIDSKTESHSFGFWPVKEKVETTLSLVNMGQGKTGGNYNSKFSGVKSGHVSGGPIEISKNETKVVNPSPKVEVIVSNFSKTDTEVSMHIKITVDIPVIGTETIYSQTLGGKYNREVVGWNAVVGDVDKHLREQKKAAEK